MASVATDTNIRKQSWATVQTRRSVVARALLAIAIPAVAACVAFLAASPAAIADTAYWNTTSGSWSNLNAWSTLFTGGIAPAAVPGANDTAIFNTSGVNAATVAILSGNTSIGGISVLESATFGGVTIRSVTTDRILTLGAGGIASLSTQGFTLGSTTAGQRVDVELAATQAWTFSQALGTTNFFVRNGVQRSAGATNQTLLIDATLKVTFGGTVANGTGGGSLSLWKRGSGEAILSVANTYSGGSTVQAGILTISNASSLGTSALKLAGGTLNVASGINFASSNVAMLGGVTLLTTGSSTSRISLGTISRPVGGGLLARNFGAAAGVTGTFSIDNPLSNGIIGPWAYGQTNANVPTWMTVSGGTIAPATLTAATNGNDLTSATTNYSSGGATTLTADRSANVWANTNTGTTNLANFNLTLSGLSNAAGTTTITASGTGRLVIGGPELVVIPSNGAIVISAGIASGTGHLTIAPYGGGGVTLSGSNAHSGGTSLHKNTLNINNADALGTGTFTIAAGSIDNSSAGAITLATSNAQVWNSDFTFVGTQNLGMGTGAVSLGSYAGTTRTVTVNSSTFTIGGGIMNGTYADLPTTGLTKAGVGALVLSGSSSYTGPTTVAAGSLFMDGRLTSSAVTVQSGGLLGGSGTLGTVSVLAGGTFSPGNSPGLLSIASLSLAGTTLMEIDGTGTRGVMYDATDVSGGLTYGGSMLIDFGSSITTALPDNTIFNLFDFATYSGTFSGITTANDGSFYAGLTFVDSGNGDKWTATKDSQTLEFTHSTGNLVIVPEPAALALAGIGIAAAGWTFCRRRR
jgi:autotransporter-associated beta strand protein